MNERVAGVTWCCEFCGAVAFGEDGLGEVVCEWCVEEGIVKVANVVVEE